MVFLNALIYKEKICCINLRQRIETLAATGILPAADMQSTNLSTAFVDCGNSSSGMTKARRAASYAIEPLAGDALQAHARGRWCRTECLC
jgi:hypothetical protein